MDRQPISVFLKQRRQELGLSLKEAARRTGIQPSRLHDLEQGKNSSTGRSTAPTRANICQIARGYAVSEDYILDLMGRPSLEATSDRERRLLSHFRTLKHGHQDAVLGLVDALYELDTSP
ncbi:helix-turn-helix protein [compost metagenome]